MSNGAARVLPGGDAVPQRREVSCFGPWSFVALPEDGRHPVSRCRRLVGESGPGDRRGA
jgi:hypothetical protein